MATQKRDIFYNNTARFLGLTPEDIARHHQGDDCVIPVSGDATITENWWSPRRSVELNSGAGTTEGGAVL
jgi:hypothetical protein